MSYRVTEDGVVRVADDRGRLRRTWDGIRTSPAKLRVAVITVFLILGFGLVIYQWITDLRSTQVRPEYAAQSSLLPPTEDTIIPEGALEAPIINDDDFESLLLAAGSDFALVGSFRPSPQALLTRVKDPAVAASITSALNAASAQQTLLGTNGQATRIQVDSVDDKGALVSVSATYRGNDSNTRPRTVTFALGYVRQENLFVLRSVQVGQVIG